MSNRKWDSSFRHLIVWKEARNLALAVYKITKLFPKDELYGLTSQLRRASTSVMANIAEGNERVTSKDRYRFFVIAKSSLVEVDCFLDFSFELKLVSEKDYSLCLEGLNKTGYLLRKFMLASQS